MLHIYDIFKDISKWKILQPFFTDPTSEGIGLREISRLTGLSTPSVKLHLDNFVKDGILVKKDAAKYGLKRKQPVYMAKGDSESFRYLKKLNIINLLYSTGLIEYLFNKCQPDIIILFGSSSRGEDIKESDIDLYLQCSERDADLKKFESLIRRKIQLHFYRDFQKISPELKNNIINGVIMDGYLKVF